MDFIELVREAQGKKVLFAQMIEMSLLKTPFLTFSFFSFIFLFGSILTFTKLNNNYELIIAKCSGISTFSFCIPISLTVVLISFIIVFVFQPLSAICLDYNRLLGIKYLGHHAKRVSLQSHGIWLYENSNPPEESKIIFIKNIEKNKILNKVRVYIAGENNDYITSYYANTAKLQGNFLEFNQTQIFKPGKLPEYIEYTKLPTSIVDDQLNLSIPNPDIIPFWNLKSFIEQIRESGFSTLRHELYYMNMLASPLLYLALVFTALAFSTNLPRQGKIGKVFISAGSIGLIIFYAEKISNVLALTGIFPIPVASLAPNVIFLFSSIVLLIHFEEG